MTDANGTHVTRAELAAHIKGIDEHFDHIEADLHEIKRSVHSIRDAVGAKYEQARRESFGVRFKAAVVAAIPSAAIAVTTSLVTVAVAFLASGR